MKEWDGLTEHQILSIQKARKRVIESIGKNMDLYGVTLSIGHLYGNMFFENHPVTLDEMGEAMGMSKTSMSTGMRTLIDLKMVNKVWGKGSRKDLYEVETDWHQTFSDYFTVKWSSSIEINLQMLKRSLADLDRLEKEDRDNQPLAEMIAADKHKINEAITYYHWLSRLIDTFESGEIYNFVPKD
jgi:DNA-binding transcriptional regulator GbsR (MarR family)